MLYEGPCDTATLFLPKATDSYVPGPGVLALPPEYWIFPCKDMAGAPGSLGLYAAGPGFCVLEVLTVWVREPREKAGGFLMRCGV